MLTVESVQEALNGVLRTKDELDNYERIWHYGIYLPTWNELRSKVKLSEKVHKIIFNNILLAELHILIVSLNTFSLKSHHSKIVFQGLNNSL